MIRRTLSEGLQLLGSEYTDRQLSLLNAFLEEVERWNRKINLVRASDDELTIKHALDSLSGIDTIRKSAHESILDVGSGAGFPGMPLAIMLPDSKVDLLERSAKKTEFLKNAVAVLPIPNVKVVCQTLENHTDQYDVVCCRAFGKLPLVIKSLLKNLKPGGSLILYKGRESVLQEELADVPWIERYAKCSIFAVKVPFLHAERHIVKITMRLQPPLE